MESSCRKQDQGKSGLHSIGKTNICIFPALSANILQVSIEIWEIGENLKTSQILRVTDTTKRIKAMIKIILCVYQIILSFYFSPGHTGRLHFITSFPLDGAMYPVIANVIWADDTCATSRPGFKNLSYSLSCSHFSLSPLSPLSSLSPCLVDEMQRFQWKTSRVWGLRAQEDQ